MMNEAGIKMYDKDYDGATKDFKTYCYKYPDADDQPDFIRH